MAEPFVWYLSEAARAALLGEAGTAQIEEAAPAFEEAFGAGDPENPNVYFIKLTGIEAMAPGGEAFEGDAVAMVRRVSEGRWTVMGRLPVAFLNAMTRPWSTMSQVFSFGNWPASWVTSRMLGVNAKTGESARRPDYLPTALEYLALRVDSDKTKPAADADWAIGQALKVEDDSFMAVWHDGDGKPTVMTCKRGEETYREMPTVEKTPNERAAVEAIWKTLGPRKFRMLRVEIGNKRHNLDKQAAQADAAETKPVESYAPTFAGEIVFVRTLDKRYRAKPYVMMRADANLELDILPAPASSNGAWEPPERAIVERIPIEKQAQARIHFQHYYDTYKYESAPGVFIQGGHFPPNTKDAWLSGMASRANHQRNREAARRQEPEPLPEPRGEWMFDDGDNSE